MQANCTTCDRQTNPATTGARLPAIRDSIKRLKYSAQQIFRYPRATISYAYDYLFVTGVH